MRIFFIAGVLLLFTACNSQPSSQAKKVYAVGHIPLEKAILLDSTFKACNEGHLYQYYNQNAGSDKPAGYIGGATAIKKFIREHHPNLDLEGASGLFTLRFMINCEGRTDRYEWVENDLDYQPRKFAPEVAKKLFEIHQELKNWRPIYINGAYRDCFMYTTFKIKHGEIIEVLP